jgi:ubiquinone/menaquinone biosynthesis C-methylase UbiE
MGCHGGFSLDDATRRSWYSPEAVLQNLSSGMIFMDVGCGEGFFSVLAAKKVGITGKVYSVDVDASAIEKLKLKTEAEGLKNIVTKVGKAEDTVFARAVPILFLCMDLHDFSVTKP